MPQSLTLEHFDETMRAIANTLNQHSAILADHTKRFDKIDATLADHTKRLDRIEHILWDGARLGEIERRVIKLAETVGRPDLATPITRPIGS